MSRDTDAGSTGALDNVAPGPGASQEGFGGAGTAVPDLPSQQPGPAAGPAESAGSAPDAGAGSVGEAPGSDESTGEAPGRTMPRGGGQDGGGWFTRLLRMIGIR